MLDLTQAKDRNIIIEEMSGAEEQNRKQESLKQTEVYSDRIYQYVYNQLLRRYGIDNARCMPIVSSINLAKRIVTQEASLYREAPERVFTELSDDQEDIAKLIYRDMMLDAKLLMANKNYRLQNQTTVMIIPKKGKLIARVLRNHQVTVIPFKDDPEEAFAYIISSFDKDMDIESRGRRGFGNDYGFNYNDNVNQNIADPNDYKSSSARHVVWTADLNFTMDGKGNVISGDDITNPIGMLPFVDVSIEKDFEWWVRQGAGLTDATIDYNVSLSSVAQVVEMNGFAQAIVKGVDIVEQNFTVGPTRILKLEPTRLDDGQIVESDFAYANPGADIRGSIEFSEVFLSNLLTARGVDPKTINGKAEANSYASGTERLLALVERFEASVEDMHRFKYAESKIWEIVKAWHDNLQDTNLLNPKYKVSRFPEISEVLVEYSRPQSIQSEDEILNAIEKRRDLRVTSLLDEIEMYHGMDREQAEQKLKEIIADEQLEIGVMGGNESIESDEDDQAELEGLERRE